MRVEITAYHQKNDCLWCNREAEGVSARFDPAFLGEACLCWRCFQQAARVAFGRATETSGRTKTTEKSH